MPDVPLPGGDVVSHRKPVRLEDLGQRRCLVCGGELTWPSLYFDRAACSETWVARYRDEDGGLGGTEKGPARARGKA